MEPSKITLEEYKLVLEKPAWSISDIQVAFSYKDKKKARALFHKAQEHGGRLTFDERRVWRDAVYKILGKPDLNKGDK